MGNVTLTAKVEGTGEIINLVATPEGYLVSSAPGAASVATEDTLLLILAELEAQTLLLQTIATNTTPA